LLSSRVQRLETAVTEARLTAEAETARLRNEVSLAVQELGQRLDERARALREHLDGRVQVLHNFADDGAAAVIREAQATCARLADDALAAAEASQRKVEEVARHVEANQRRLEELARGTEIGLESLRTDLVSVTASSAAATAAATAAVPATQQHRPDISVCLPSAPTGTAEASMGPGTQTCLTTTAPLQQQQPGACTGSVAALPEDTTEALAEALERRLATRLGQQVLQLSEVLRRVVQAQVALHQQVAGFGLPSVAYPCGRGSGGGSPPPPPAMARRGPAEIAGSTANTDPLLAAATAAAAALGAGGGSSAGTTMQTPSDSRDRAAAIDELYRELRRLEDCGCDAAIAGAHGEPFSHAAPGSGGGSQHRGACGTMPRPRSARGR